MKLQPRPIVLNLRLATTRSFTTSTRYAMSKRHERTQSLEDVLRHPSTKRAKEIDAEPPLGQLTALIDQAKPRPEPRNVLHWFRQDLRPTDNRALHAAAKKRDEGSGALLTCYLFSPKDLEWHGESPARTDFILESLKILQKQLGEWHIPLAILEVKERSEKTEKITRFIRDNDVSHLFANIEYEVDELRRDIDMFQRLETEKMDVSFDLYHDQTIVKPATLVGSGGKPIRVYTPYHRVWLAEVADKPDLIETVDAPSANDESARKKLEGLFASEIPALPQSKQFDSEEDRLRIRRLWPAGHDAALERMQHFLFEKVETYAANRSNPAKDNSSRLSPYFSSGVLGIRETLSACRDTNGGSAHFGGKGTGGSAGAGLTSWVRELVFREFYRHMTALAPHDAMNLPHNLKFDFVQWEEDEEGWRKWCEGTTGMPFIDAGMRQIRHEAYMHNRLRMNVASYLRTNLLIDYRRGERFFVEHLVDWDLCNNTNGWEPSYTVFNPVSQAEKNDPDGEYIRRWVPELRDVKGKAVFDPFHRLSREDFQKLGYPEPHVDWKESKQRCIERYKSDMAHADP